MSRFQFVADHSDTFEVKWLCQIVEVARSSFYAWVNAAATRTARTLADDVLAQRIRAVHIADTTYGAPRNADIVAHRERNGVQISMADGQIAAICRNWNAGLATRNVSDFVDTGVELINPWDLATP